MSDTGVLDETATAGAGSAGATTGTVDTTGQGTGSASDVAGQGGDQGAAGNAQAGDNTGQGSGDAGTNTGDQAGDKSTTAYWPDDWRQKIAGDDSKALKRLERYASPEAAIQALFAAQAKISSGELKSALKPDASPEELKAWRTENGIPEAPEGYELKLANGLVVGEEDKPLVDEFLKAAHTANLHPNQVNEVLNWHYANEENEIKAQVAADQKLAGETYQALKQEWGFDYNRNINLMPTVFSEEVFNALCTARTADGRILGDMPEMNREMVRVARELNPLATIIPGSGTNSMIAMEDELASIEKMMGDRESEYWKGPKADRLQARYRELIDTRNKLQKK